MAFVRVEVELDDVLEDATAREIAKAVKRNGAPFVREVIEALTNEPAPEGVEAALSRLFDAAHMGRPVVPLISDIAWRYFGRNVGIS